MKKEPTTYEEWLVAEGKLCAEPDDCQFCLGQKGGVPGNENIIGGITVCDYCTTLVATLLANREKEQQAH